MPLLDNDLLNLANSGELPATTGPYIGSNPSLQDYPSFEMFYSSTTGINKNTSKPRTFDDIVSTVNSKKESPLLLGSKPQTIVSASELLANKRYSQYLPGADNEDIYGQNQGVLAKAANATLKGLSLAGTTFAQSTVGLVYGVGKALDDGKFSSFYDNDFNRALDTWNKGLEDKLPNYYRKVETDADWYSPDNLFTANFLFDKVIKNLGFAAGAAASGMVYSRVLNAIAKSAKAFSVGKTLQAVEGAEAAATSRLSSVEGLTNFSTNIEQLNASAITKYNILNKGQRAVVAGLSTVGEAQFEAMHNLNEFRSSLISEYEKKNGERPTGQALKDINDQAENVGDMSFVLNSALLTATQYIQLPRILGTSYSAGRNVATGMAPQINNIVKNAKGEFVREAPKFGKLVSKIPSGKYFWNEAEAFEEGAQYAIQMGSQNYYNKKYRGEDNDFLSDVIEYGASKVFNTKEGVESLLIGGLSGAIMTARGKYQQNRQTNVDTTAAISAFNQSGMSPFLKEGIDGANRGVTLQENWQDAVYQGDILEAKDLERDYVHNYLTPRIKYNRFDLVMEDLEMHRQLASTAEGFAQLKDEGKAAELDTRQNFLQRLDNIENHARHMNTLYQSLNLRYKNLVSPKDGSRIYSDEVIDKMVYAASKIADYDRRLPELSTKLADFNVSNEPIIEAIYQKPQEVEKLVQTAIDQINSLNIFDDSKDELKVALRDTMELTKRKKFFLDEYATMKKSPEKYTNTKDVVPIDELLSDKVKIGDKEFQVGKRYYGSKPYVRDGNKITIFPEIDLTDKNLANEVRAVFPEGSKYVSPNDLKKFDLTDVPVANRDLLEPAIIDAIGNLLPEGVTDPSQITDPALVDEIEDAIIAAIKSVSQVIKKQEAVKQKASKLISHQSTIQGQSGETITDEGDLDEAMDLMDGFVAKKPIHYIGKSSSTISKGLQDHHEREQYFVNNLKNLPNKKDIHVISVTQKSQVSMGLPGLVEKLHPSNPNYMDPTNGVIALVYVVVEDEVEYFVDKEGNRLNQVGEVTSLDEAVYTVLSSTSLNWSEDYGGISRYHNPPSTDYSQEEYQQAARQLRARILSLDEDSFETSRFTVSRGLPVEVKDKKGKRTETNPIVGTLVTPEDLTKQLLVVSTTGVVTSNEGIAYQVPKGKVVLVNEDTIQIVNNRNFTPEEQENLFDGIKLLAKRAAKTGGFDKQIIRYLQGHLYWGSPRDGAVANDKQVWVDHGGMLNLGKSIKIPFSTEDIASKESVIKGFLARSYNNVNSHFLKKEQFSEPFDELQFSEDTVRAVSYPNYQAYLLTKSTPLLTTTVRRVSKDIPNDRNFIQKYIILDDVKLEPKKKVAEVKKETPKEQPVKKEELPKVDRPVLDGKTVNTHLTSKGEKVLYIASPTEFGIVEEGSDIDKIADRLKVSRDQALALAKGSAQKEVATFLTPKKEADPQQEAIEKILRPTFDLPLLSDAKILKTKIKETVVSAAGKSTQRDVEVGKIQQRVSSKLSDLQNLIKCLHG